MSDTAIQWKGDTALPTSTPGKKKRIRMENDSLKWALRRSASDGYAVRGRKPWQTSKANLLNCSSSSSIPSRPAPQSHHECPLLSPGNDANGTGSHCRSPNARGGLCWRRNTGSTGFWFPKRYFFPLCWTGGSILLHFLSLWISFLDYFRLCGAEWSFDVKKL